jgi:hypothetical protein
MSTFVMAHLSHGGQFYTRAHLVDFTEEDITALESGGEEEMIRFANNMRDAANRLFEMEPGVPGVPGVWVC